MEQRYGFGVQIHLQKFSKLCKLRISELPVGIWFFTGKSQKKKIIIQGHIQDFIKGMHKSEKFPFC